MQTCFCTHYPNHNNHDSTTCIPLVARVLKVSSRSKTGLSFYDADGKIFIYKIREGGLFESTNLQEGMQVLSVNNSSTEGKNAEMLAKLIHGVEGTVEILAAQRKEPRVSSSSSSLHNSDMMLLLPNKENLGEVNNNEPLNWDPERIKGIRPEEFETIKQDPTLVFTKDVFTPNTLLRNDTIEMNGPLSCSSETGPEVMTGGRKRSFVGCVDDTNDQNTTSHNTSGSTVKRFKAFHEYKWNDQFERYQNKCICYYD